MFGSNTYDAGNHICGLYFTTRNLHRTYLPQVELVSETTINPVCFTTKLRQTFRNTSKHALPQVRYTFPLYDGVAVNSYSIHYGHKTLKGIVKQKDVAKKDYQAAVDRGETAGLLESLPAGVFGVTLGNVSADADIVVDITYCGELKHDAGIDGLRYMLPTSIAPRCGEYPGEVMQSNAIVKKGITIRVGMDLAGSAIRRVQSPSHPISVSMGGLLNENGEPSTKGDFQPSQAAATLTLGSTELGGDFILQLLVDNINKPQAILESHPTMPNQRAIMATLVPNFTLQPAHPEIVFIADQSGSMSGQKNTALVSALKIFLKSLPLGIRFNVCAFGNRFQFLWPTSQAYTESNVNAAVAFVDSFKASYGGTEILKPIKAAFEHRLKDLPLEIMLLTDGEVWQEDAIFAYINEQIRDQAVDARIFTLGIGNDVSHTLVEGVARAGNGFAQFVTQNEDTDQKVIRMLKGALYAHTKDYEIELHYADDKADLMTDDDDFEIVEKVSDCLSITDKPAPPAYDSAPPATISFFDPSAQPDKPADTPVDRYAHLPHIETPKILQAPHEVPPLFPFNRTTLYLLLGPSSAQKSVTSLTIRAQSHQGPLELTIPVHQGLPTGDQGSIHHLAARKAIQDLVEGRGWIHAAKLLDGTTVKTKHESRFDELVEREGVRLGEMFQVAGKWTSFVAVEDGKQADAEAESDQVTPPTRALWQQMQHVGKMKQQRSGGLRGGAPSLMSLQSLPNPSASRDRRHYRPDSGGRGAKGSSSFGHGNGGGDFSRQRGGGAGAPAPPPSMNSFSAPPPPSSRGPPPALFSGSIPAMSSDLLATYSSEMASPASMPLRDDSDNDDDDDEESDGSPRFLRATDSDSDSADPAACRLSVNDTGVPNGLASATPKNDQDKTRQHKTPDQIMHGLIAAQTFAGCWHSDVQLFNITKLSAKAFAMLGAADLAQVSDLHADACATALVLAWLETKMCHCREVWEMVAEKGRVWLRSQLAGNMFDGKDAEGMIESARAYWAGT